MIRDGRDRALCHHDRCMCLQVGVFHEAALQRYDYVLAAAGLIGIRLILCVQNHWDVRRCRCWLVADWCTDCISQDGMKL